MSTVLALDGHDGSGKTTLSKQLAESVGARYVRPFEHPYGEALMRAYENGNHHGVIDVGFRALSGAITKLGSSDGILDRGWLTVSTLVPADVFAASWRFWVPTVLLTCDLTNTLARIGARESEPAETNQWHQDFLELYDERRQDRYVPVLRTDSKSVDQCVADLVKYFEKVKLGNQCEMGRGLSDMM